MFHVYRVFTYNPAPLGICVFCMHLLRQSCFLEVICMHFYVSPARLNSSGDHLYVFLRGVHSPGRHLCAFSRGARPPEFPWGLFVCIFTWCTFAWAPLDTISMHFYVRPAHLNSPWGPFACILTWCTVTCQTIVCIFTWGPLP